MTHLELSLLTFSHSYFALRSTQKRFLYFTFLLYFSFFLSSFSIRFLCVFSSFSSCISFIAHITQCTQNTGHRMDD